MNPHRAALVPTAVRSGSLSTDSESRAVATVDAGAIARNCRRIKQRIGGETELCAVVKADGYGHGAKIASAAALSGGASRLAVATVGEAARLRPSFPRVPLLILGPLTKAELRQAMALRCEVGVWDEGFIEQCIRMAADDAHLLSLHLKFDSGMGRLGEPDPGRILQLAQTCSDNAHVSFSGLWTHFATADEEDESFLSAQLRSFNSVVKGVRRIASDRLIVHAANSAAAFRDEASHFDLVRCGIATYGLDPFGRDPADHDLEPALSLRSYLAQVKRFSPGRSVGYGRTWTAQTETWIGLVPVGYGDGFRRTLSNKADVLVGGHRRPVVGAVSMDMLTVSLGVDTDLRPGDPVVLIGSQGTERLLAEEFAAHAGTINYEVTCGISPRVPRRTIC